MPRTLVRDAILYLVKFPLFRPMLARVAQKRYDIQIDSSAFIHPSVQLPKHLVLEADVAVLPTATLSPHVRLKARSVLIDSAPRGAEMSGNPAEVVRFQTIGEKATQARPLAQEALHALIHQFQFNTVLDIGCGEGWHANRLLEHGKNVTCVDLGSSCYFQNNRAQDGLKLVIGDYLTLDFNTRFDCIWLSHVLEHQLNVQQFLQKIHHDLAEGGILAITVPPLKDDIVGGHVNLFNMGLLLYRLILAGFDCSQAHCKSYGYNLSVILRKKSITLPAMDFDKGDVDRLSEFFPFGAVEGFFGEIERVNWPWPSRDYFSDIENC